MPLKSGPLPTFADIELSNHTARVGNEVSFGCTVKNLGNYKVEYLRIFTLIKHETKVLKAISYFWMF